MMENQYLHDVDEECHREVELAVKRIMEKEGVTEQLKNEKISLVDYSYEISKRVGAGESVSSAAGRANGYVKAYAELDELANIL